MVHSLSTFFTGALLGPPLAGAIYGATDGYELPFFVAGGFFILASLIGGCAQILNRKMKNATYGSKKAND